MVQRDVWRQLLREGVHHCLAALRLALPSPRRPRSRQSLVELAEEHGATLLDAVNSPRNAALTQQGVSHTRDCREGDVSEDGASNPGTPHTLARRRHGHFKFPGWMLKFQIKRTSSFHLMRTRHGEDVAGDGDMSRGEEMQR